MSSPRPRGCSPERVFDSDMKERRPRARGAVPSGSSLRDAVDRSSPRPRGCSLRRPRHHHDRRRRPRARGAVPEDGCSWQEIVRSSPRPRGCSLHPDVDLPRDPVVPAPAGLFPPARQPTGTTGSRPRARGAVPPGRRMRTVRPGSSPRPRGCSGSRRLAEGHRRVVPAPAGLFRPAAARSRPAVCRPRARGAVPLSALVLRASGSSSPRPRGCSGRDLS